jgi:hypothetical protein
MPVTLPDLAVKRYTEFIESFNKFKLVDYEIDLSTYNYQEKLLAFYTKVESDEKLFKYLLNRDKLLFHKNYNLSFINKIKLYNLLDSNIDQSLNSFVWETIQMIHLIIADGQNELSKNQVHVDALLDKLDGMGKKKNSIDMKKISNVISKIDSSVLTEFLSVSGLDKIDISSIDMSQFQDFRNMTPDKIKNIIASTGIDKIDMNGVIDKLSEKGDAEKGQKYIQRLIEKLIEDYNRDDSKDKMDSILDFAIEKAQDRLEEFIGDGTLTIYDVIAGTKNLKENKDVELTEKLRHSKLFKDGSTISIKDIISKFTSRIMSQIGRDKANGNLSDDQMKSLEEFLKNQKI